MVKFTTTIKKFDKQGEKTGWTYIEINEAIAAQLLANNKKAFRVKGKFDSYTFEGVSTLPMGGGNFIIPLNNAMRKALGKTKGSLLQVQLQLDTKKYELCKDLIDCLADEPAALLYFKKLPPSHQNYYSKWVESAKTEVTKAKRIAQAINAMAKEIGYSEMMKSARNVRE